MSESGIVYGMANAAYHALSDLGSSGLTKFMRSPFHYWSTSRDPNRPAPGEPTPAMAAGTLAHYAILEPDEVAKRYVVRPQGFDGRTKEGKAWAANCPPGLEVVSADQMQTAQRQAASVRLDPEIRALLEDGQSEVSAFWRDTATGVAGKCRPDRVVPAGTGNIIVDVKTTRDASESAFQRSVANFGYARQARWYSRGYEAASGLPVHAFVLLTVEADYPHASRAWILSDQWLAAADDEINELLPRFAECEATGVWPSYPGSVHLLEMPAWLARSTFRND